MRTTRALSSGSQKVALFMILAAVTLHPVLSNDTPTPAPTSLGLPTWNVWTGYGHLFTSIVIGAFFTVWNSLIGGIVVDTPVGWFQGKCRVSPACICPHWVLGIVVPFLIGGVLIALPVVMIPYGVHTCVVLRKDDGGESSRGSSEVCDCAAGTCCGTPCLAAPYGVREQQQTSAAPMPNVSTEFVQRTPAAEQLNQLHVSGAASSSLADNAPFIQATVIDVEVGRLPSSADVAHGVVVVDARVVTEENDGCT